MNTRFFVAGLLMLALSGCLGSTSQPPTFYMLTARATPAGTPAANGTTLGVGPVRVAPFLMRPQIVMHAGSGDLQISDGQRWSEPLEQGIQRVLLQNLATLTGADTRNFPWTQTTAPQYALRVDVVDLDRRTDGSTLLEVNWILEDVAKGKLLSSRRERFTTEGSASAVDYSALASTYSDLMAQLATRMAQELTDQARKK